LKEKIEAGEYNTLISDEASGRILTLILRAIIKRVSPDLKLNTLFVSGGFESINDYHKKLEDFFKKIASKIKRALLVTEFIFHGKTMGNFFNELIVNNIGFDAATLYQYDQHSMDSLRQLADHAGGQLIVGETDYGKAPGGG